MFKFKFIRVLKVEFFTVALLNGLNSGLKFLLQLITNKFVALYIGTDGIALTGQLQNFLTIVTQLSNGGFNNGIIRYLAEPISIRRKIDFINVAFSLCLLTTVFFVAVMFIFSSEISQFIFANGMFDYVVKTFALLLMFTNSSAIYMAILNGRKLFARYYLFNISSTIISFFISYILIKYKYLGGSLLAMVVAPSVVFIFQIYDIFKYNLLSTFKIKFDVKIVKKYAIYSLTTIVGAVLWPTVSIFVRDYIMKNISIEEAGYWQAARNINDYIVNILITTLSVYLLPRFSGMVNKSDIKNELYKIYVIIVPAAILLFIFINLFKVQVIELLYSSKLVPVGNYLFIQSIGSFFWLCKIPMVLLFIAKGLNKVLILIELFFAAFYLSLVFYNFLFDGVMRIQIAFVLYNLFYFVFLYVFLNYKYFHRNND